MSLINRMLRDLSSRQPQSGNVMGGIQLPNAAPASGGGLPGKLGALLVLVVVFTAGLWFVFGPKPVKIPQPRGLPPGAVVAESAPAPTEPLKASAPGEPAQLQMDTQLSAAPATPPAEPKAAPATEAATAAPPRIERARKAQPAGPTPGITTKSSASRAAERYADARRALERGDKAAAEEALIDALALDPRLHAAREDLANLRIAQGRFDEAENTVRAGLDVDPSRVSYRRLVARLELARGRPVGAIEVLERDPPPVERDPEYHALLASAYQRVNRHEDASRSYRSLAQAHPDVAAWWAGYGLSRDALGDSAGALAAYARARQVGGLDPRVLEHLNRRTLALQQAG